MSSTQPLLPSWMSRLMWRRVVAPSSRLASSRIEVCPPELWPSSLTLSGRARRWLAASRWVPAPVRPAQRLAQVKAEFGATLQDMACEQGQALAFRIVTARSLRELWHLRLPLYSLVSTTLSQSEAERRIATLNRHFPTRAPRSGLMPLAD
jgi:hypothetical protein